jgi:tetratricopeptide (TPR) repeat protein
MRYFLLCSITVLAFESQFIFVRASDRQLLNAIFELEPTDAALMPSETLVKECSEILSRRNKEKPEAVAKALYYRASGLLALRKLKDAKADLDELCSIKPEDAEARILRASVLLSLQSVDEAEIDAKQAIKLDPKRVRGYVLVANIYAIKGNTDETSKWIAKALNIDKDCPEAIFLQGYVSLSNKEYAKCLDDLNRFLQLRTYLGPAPDAPYWIRGMALLALDRNQESLDSFQMAKVLNPASANATWGLYMACSNLGKPHLALVLAEELARLAPNEPRSHLSRAKAYAKLAKKQNALEAIDKALGLFTTPNAQTLSEIGSIHVILEDYTEALQSFNQALDMDKNHFQTIAAMSDVMATCPDAKVRNGPQALILALQAHEKAKNVDNQKQKTAILLAQAYAECGEFNKAVEFAKQAIEIAPPDSKQKMEFQEKLMLFEKNIPYRAKSKPGENKPKQKEDQEKGIAPSKIGKGGSDVRHRSETFHRSPCGVQKVSPRQKGWVSGPAGRGHNGSA